MTTLSDWFDPYDIEHCRAYRFVEINGHLPEGFVPEHVDFDIMWQVVVAAKMGQAWLDAVEQGKVDPSLLREEDQSP